MLRSTPKKSTNSAVEDTTKPPIPLVFTRFPHYVCRKKGNVSSQAFDQITLYAQIDYALKEGLDKVICEDGKYKYDVDLKNKVMKCLAHPQKKKKDLPTYALVIHKMPPVWYFESEGGYFVPHDGITLSKFWASSEKGENVFKIQWLGEASTMANDNAMKFKVAQTVSTTSGSISSFVGKYAPKMLENASVDTTYEVDMENKVMKLVSSGKTFKLVSWGDIWSKMHWIPKFPEKFDHKDVRLEALKPDDEEYRRVSDFFFLSMPSKQAPKTILDNTNPLVTKIVSVEKVYNPLLRMNYLHELNMVKAKHDNANIDYVRLLWNGTGTTNPSVIYSSEKGWMINYSTDGNLWGKGAYFTEDASYVCGRKRQPKNALYKYAHTTEKGTIKLFLAEVITGESIQMDETGNLPEPPMKYGKNLRFDSVMGYRHGSFIWVVKDNARAYPTYLVEFEIV